LVRTTKLNIVVVYDFGPLIGVRGAKISKDKFDCVVKCVPNEQTDDDDDDDDDDVITHQRAAAR